MARRKTSIPASPRELDADWITGAMRSTGVIDGATRVESVDFEPLGGAVGFGGDTVRLRLRYSPHGAGPATAVAKFASADPTIKGLFESIDSYGREIAFYQRLAARSPVRVPGHFGSAMDPPPPAAVTRFVSRLINNAPKQVHIRASSNVVKLLRPSKRRYALLIEEIGGARMYDMASPPPVDELGAVVDGLARLHAEFWGEVTLVGANFSLPVLGAMPKMYANTYDAVNRPMAIERWDWLTDRHVALLDDAVAKLLDDHDVINLPITLLHGDARVDNVMFLRDEPPALIDWGSSTIGHPGFDLAYALSSAIDRPDEGQARADLDQLVARYRRTLESEGRGIDAAELDRGVQAGLRAHAVQLMAALPVLEGGYGEASLTDCWIPRLVALLDPLT